MLGEIIAVGEEVLSGDVLNSNAAAISSRLADIGVFCRFHSVVGDYEEDIVTQLEMASKRSQIVILCGGLGPTKDDLTKESVAVFLGKLLYEDSALKERIDTWFAKRNYKPSANNYKQALMIEGGKSLVNQNGTAPGVYIEAENVHYFLLPGPPNELLPMFEACVLPVIKPMVSEKIMTKTYKLVNIGESAAVTIIDDIMNSEGKHILAPYAKLSEVHLKATAIGSDSRIMNQWMDMVEKRIHERLGQYVYSTSDQDLVDVVIDLLKKHGMTIGTAESCTGGIVADSFVNKAGVSSVFMEGAVTYSNKSKVRNLGVDEGLLDQYGAVSEEVAYAMVEGVMNRFGVDAGISITGIAGPDGGTEEKPVGLVYIGIGLKGKIKVVKHNFLGNRDKIRQNAAKRAIIGLYDELKVL